MRYFKYQGDVYAFSDDVSDDPFIHPEMVPLTADEEHRHLNPELYLTAEQQRQLYLQTLKPLTRRQFKLVLLQQGLLDKVATAISNITDENLRLRIQIEYEDSTTFERENETLAQLYKALGLKENQVDRMWEEGLKL